MVGRPFGEAVIGAALLVSEIVRLPDSDPIV
jgi:hypothetical protein